MGLRLENGEIIDTDIPTTTARFYEHAKKVGIGQYETVVNIELKARGYKDTYSRLATDADKVTYRDAWERFEKQLGEVEGHTPLTMLPAMKAAFRLELENMGVTCVEDFAALPRPERNYLVKPWQQAKRYVELENMDDGETVGEEPGEEAVGAAPAE